MNPIKKYILILLLSGCASGPNFKRVELQGNESVVYFYRPAFIGLARDSIKIVDTKTNKCIAELLPGGYYPYIAPAGEKTFICYDYDKNDICEKGKMTLRTKPKQEYFVESTFDIWTLEFRFLAPAILEQIPSKEALKELKNKKLSIIKGKKRGL